MSRSQLTTIASVSTMVGIRAVMLGLAFMVMFGVLHPARTSVMLALVALAGTDLVVRARARVALNHRVPKSEAVERARARLLGTDDLTGALSRRAFLDRLNATVKRDMSGQVTLLIVDVDDFKAFNDSFGHGAGDQVLQRLVALARLHFPGAAIGRLGGDEFAILVAGARGRDSVITAGFLADLRQPTPIAGRHLGIGVSIGAAIAPDHTAFADEIMSCADLALYESKRRGRGCATQFDEALTASRKNHRLIERELRAAVLLNELDVVYQRVIDPADELVAVEALVRWNHPLRGVIPPGDFIEVAEQSTLIDMVGEWVLRRALRDAAALPGLRIAVNVSGAQLKRDGLVDMVTRALAESGCEARRLTLEITETVAVTATPAILRRLASLRELGLSISLDDFGTGNAGFQALRSFPIDCIKIDRSYIAAMTGDPLAATIVSALAAIGRIQGLPVVAEGIETIEQRRAAEAAGCTLFQGYLLGRPAKLEALMAQGATEPSSQRLA